MQNAGGLRIDKWLWHARFCKTRAQAQSLAAAGLVRMNGVRVEKPSVLVRAGAVLTLPARGQIVTVRVIALGERRGSSLDAYKLYEWVKQDA